MIRHLLLLAECHRARVKSVVTAHFVSTSVFSHRSVLPCQELPPPSRPTRRRPRATAFAGADGSGSKQHVQREAERFQQALTLARNDAAVVTAGRPSATFHDAGPPLRYIGALLRKERHKADFATGYFSLQGLMLLLPELANKPKLLVRLLVGMKDANSKAAAAQALREHLIRNLSTGCMENAADDEEPLATIETTREMLESGRLRLNELNALKARAAQGMLHSKVYITSAAVRHARRLLKSFRAGQSILLPGAARHQEMLVTSANLSKSGLLCNIEAGVITSPDPTWSTDNLQATLCTRYDFEAHQVKFQHFWEMGTDVTEETLADVRALLTPQLREVLLARAVEALVPDEAAPIDLLPTMKQLAPFQLKMKRSVLNGLQSHGTHFLIGDVGLGKTVVAVAAAYELRRVVPTVIVVAPAGTHATWTNELNRGGVRDRGVFTLQALSGSRRAKAGPLSRRVALAFDAADEHVLIILDEAHLLRNRFVSKSSEDDDAEEKGEERAAYTQIREAVTRRGAKLLIMTGTPYGAELANVINQLDLVGATLPMELANLCAQQSTYAQAIEQTAEERIKSDKLVEWMRSPQDYVSIYTLKDIEETFGEEDENGDCYVPFGPDGTLRKYRPGIRRESVPFMPVMGDAAEQVEAIRVLSGPLAGNITNVPSHTRRTGRSAGGADPVPISPLEQTMQTALLSSPAAWHEALVRATSSDGWENRLFVDSDLSARASAAKALKRSLEGLTPAKAVVRDFKLKKLVAIAHDHLQRGEKLLIFVDRVATAAYLKICLQHAVDSISGQPRRHVTKNSKRSLQRAEEGIPLRSRRYIIESTAPASSPEGKKSLVEKCADPDDLDADILAEMVARFAPKANSYVITSDTPEIDILVATERSRAGINMQDAVAVAHYDLASQAIDAEQREGRLLRFKDNPSTVTAYTFEPDIEQLVANPNMGDKSRAYVERLSTPTTRLEERRDAASTFKEQESAKGSAGPSGDIFFWDKVKRDLRRGDGGGGANRQRRGAAVPAAGLSGVFVHPGPHRLLLLLLDYTTGDTGGSQAERGVGGGQRSTPAEASSSSSGRGRIEHVVYNIDTNAVEPATRAEWLDLLASAEAPQGGLGRAGLSLSFRLRGPALRAWARASGVPREHLQRDAEEGEPCVIVKQAVLLDVSKAQPR